MRVTRINEFEALVDHAEGLEALLLDIQAFIEDSAGCLGCRVLRDVQEARRFVILEVWEDRTSHRASLATAPREKFEEIMVMLAAPPFGSYLQTVGDDAGSAAEE